MYALLSNPHSHLFFYRFLNKSPIFLALSINDTGIEASRNVLLAKRVEVALI
jgi:hypothetical protein